MPYFMLKKKKTGTQEWLGRVFSETNKAWRTQLVPKNIDQRRGAELVYSVDLEHMRWCKPEFIGGKDVIPFGIPWFVGRLTKLTNPGNSQTKSKIKQDSER